ncbi:trichohyalin-like [Diorhabda carinulata]|uniref:trichohyalin-like n=1 Tax=Diorhabda carinulata TaxID=1163345 RepID=UPI0025A24FAF|nr:trichohyalin-like [Diorhabda carinulata]
MEKSKLKLKTEEERRRTVEEEVRRKEEEEEERRKIEWELIERQRKNKKINRSTDRVAQSTILEEEKEEEDEVKKQETGGDESSEGALLKKIIFGTKSGKKREREKSRVEGEIENKKEKKEGETITVEEEEREIDDKILEIKNMLGGDKKLIKKLEELRELISNKNLRNIGKKRCRECIEEEEKQRKKEKTQKIIKEIDTGDGEYEVWERLAGEEWEEVYKKTKWERERVENVLRERLSNAIIIGKGVGGTTIELIKKIREEMWGVLEKTGPGEIELIENNIKTKNNRRMWINYMVKLGDEEGEFKTIMNLVKLAKEKEEKNIKVIIGEGVDKIKIRKIIEFVGRTGETEWSILTKGEEVVRIGGGGSERDGGESLFIKTGMKKYTEVLKTIKTNVDVDELGIKVESVRKTGRGTC